MFISNKYIIAILLIMSNLDINLIITKYCPKNNFPNSVYSTTNQLLILEVINVLEEIMRSCVDNLFQICTI